MSPAILIPAAALVLLVAGACDSPSGSNPPTGTPGIAVVAGASQTDTVDAILAQPLVVQVNGSDGRPLANAEVGFLATAIAEGSDQPTVLVSPTRGTGGGTYALERTDAQGRAAVRIRMYRRAMAGGVVVAVPALEDFVVAEYTILPGAARTLAALPADTALLVGGTFTLGAAALDRHGNARASEGVAFRVVSGPVTLGGATVAGTAVGRAAVVAELGQAVDTAYVSVVPDATIAAYTAVAVTNQRANLYTLRLDGAQLLERVTTAAPGGYNGTMGSAWNADGSKLFFHDLNDLQNRSLYVLDVATGTRQRLLPEADRMLEESWPRFANGWVYFEGGSFDDRSQGTVNEPLVYRARPDGTGKTQVTRWDHIGTSRQGVPSPDGAQVAFIGSFARPMPLHVMEVATREMRSLGVIGLSPRWKRDGSEIYYIATSEVGQGWGQIRAIRPDGTGDRAVAPGDRYTPHFDLSPDGAYLIASNAEGVLTLIQAATGLELPIRTPGLSQGLMAPSWKP